MQIESLKVFCDLARQCSFSRAAAANGISQSAVSQVVLQLEKRLGTPLVDRSRRPLRLTRAGRIYYEGCRKLMEQYQVVEAAVRKMEVNVPSVVHVAAIYSISMGDMNEHIRRFGELHPGVKVDIDYVHPDKVYRQVQDGTADLGLLSFPRASRRLAAVPWRKEEMVLACPPAHPFSGRRAVRPTQLQGERYVGFERGLEIRRQVDRFLRRHGVSVNVVFEFDNIEYIKKAIEVSSGVALLPRPALEREVKAGTLAAVPLADARMVRPLGIITRRLPRPGPLASGFVKFLRTPRPPGP